MGVDHEDAGALSSFEISERMAAASSSNESFMLV
jgi:hypothetical protein